MLMAIVMSVLLLSAMTVGSSSTELGVLSNQSQKTGLGLERSSERADVYE
jgi:hypothetical protein